MNGREPIDAGRAIEAAYATLAFLREPGRCAWDHKQTLTSLAPYLIEEAHEAVEAGARNDMPGLKEELGDVLLQVLFQSMIAAEEGHFSLQEVAVGLRNKLIRRHPHLLEENGEAAPPGRKALSWEEVKRLERPRGSDPLEGVPRSLPALLKARRMQEKRGQSVALAGERATLATSLSDKATWLTEAINAHPIADPMTQTRIGDLLFAVVSASRLFEVDAEQALTDAAERFAANSVAPIQK